MADGVSITAGSGTKVATDDCGASGHAQVMKLAVSGDGDATFAPVDSTYGVGTDVKRLVPGTGATNLGKAEDAGHTTGDTGVMPLGVRNDALASFSGTDLDYTPPAMTAEGRQIVFAHDDQKTTVVTSGGLTTASTAYTSGDQVGTLFTIANAARASGGEGEIIAVSLVSAADQIGAFDVVFFKASVTLASDNSPFAISDADALYFVGIAPLAGAWDIGNNRTCQFAGSIPYACSGGTSLYAALITRTGHTFFGATTDLQLSVTMNRKG